MKNYYRGRRYLELTVERIAGEYSTPPIPVSYQNSVEVPEVEAARKANDPWIRCEYVSGDVEQIALSTGGRREETAEGHIIVYTKELQGYRVSNEIVSAFAQAFELETDLGDIRVWTPKLRPGPESPKWVVQRLVIPMSIYSVVVDR